MSLAALLGIVALQVWAMAWGIRWQMRRGRTAGPWAPMQIERAKHPLAFWVQIAAQALVAALIFAILVVLIVGAIRHLP